MISKPFGIALLGLGLLSLAAAVILLKMDNARLRKRTAEAQHEHAKVVRVREENRRTRELLEKADVSQQEAASAIHAQVVQSREELARVEKQAVEMHATIRMKAGRDADLLATNRDLRRGFVRLEHISDVGTDTPDSVLQTLIWAALKGKDGKLTSLIGLSPLARDEARRLIATLPVTVQPAWTPEKLAGLFFTGFLTEISAVAVESVATTGATQATIVLRATNGAKEITLPLAAEAVDGVWRVMLPDQAIGSLQRRMAAVAKNLPAN